MVTRSSVDDAILTVLHMYAAKSPEMRFGKHQYRSGGYILTFGSPPLTFGSPPLTFGPPASAPLPVVQPTTARAFRDGVSEEYLDKLEAHWKATGTDPFASDATRLPVIQPATTRAFRDGVSEEYLDKLEAHWNANATGTDPFASAATRSARAAPRVEFRMLDEAKLRQQWEERSAAGWKKTDEIAKAAMLSIERALLKSGVPVPSDPVSLAASKNRTALDD